MRTFMGTFGTLQYLNYLEQRKIKKLFLLYTYGKKSKICFQRVLILKKKQKKTVSIPPHF